MILIKKTLWTRPKIGWIKRAEYVFAHFDSGKPAMNCHKLYDLRAINVYTYYKNYDYIWENLSLFINMLFVKAPNHTSITIPRFLNR